MWLHLLSAAATLFVSLANVDLSLLSNYKICGHAGCESPMSRVQAIRDHRGLDCHFLTFRRGENIFVYHKLTGQRSDLWAGSIDKQFGYFPKDSVKVEEVYAVMEKTVQTQKSDFFCTDEAGYPTDSPHLDTDDVQEIQESQTTRTSSVSDDKNAGRRSAPAQSPVSRQEADGPAVRPPDEEQPAAVKEQELGDNQRKTSEEPSEGLDIEGMNNDKDGQWDGDTRTESEKGGAGSRQDMMKQAGGEVGKHSAAVMELLQVVSSLPEDIRPGPDLYGLPWEPVIFSSVVGLVTVLLFSCRCYRSVKSRLYRRKEHQMAEQVSQLLEEKCEVLQTLSQIQQEFEDLECSLKNKGILAQMEKTEHLEAKARQIECSNRELERDSDSLKDQLDQHREHQTEQEKRTADLEEMIKTLEEETNDFQSQYEQAQTSLKVYSMNSERLQNNLEMAVEENNVLQQSNTQLHQQVEGWAERVSELEEEMRRCEVNHSRMLQDAANKDEHIVSLTDRLLRMKAWVSDIEDKEFEEGAAEEAPSGRGRAGTGTHQPRVQKLIYAAKLNADLKSVDEDKDRVFARLNDEVRAAEDLQESTEQLRNEQIILQTDTERYSDQVQRLQQKLQIMTEMYQENELKLHRLLTVEEKERLQKEEKLSKADRNITLAMEELNNYRQRAEEMEEELEKTKQSYQTQISAHERKAHNNWLAARAADRELTDIRREHALLRQKLTDTQFKLDALDKDPYALNSLARPLPFRGERSPFGPSPLGRPSSETRQFPSPPTLMDGPPSQLPRVLRGGPVEPREGQGEMERSGGAHSDSGSNSPTWDRDRRGPPPGSFGPPPGSFGPPPGPVGPPGPPGYMFPEAGGPIYRRPAPPPGPMGPLPPLVPLHTFVLPPVRAMGPLHPADLAVSADGPFRENSLRPADLDHREPSLTDRQTPPEPDQRPLARPPFGSMMGPVEGPFPRRAPYEPLPPDFYPSRGPGGPPMMPGLMFPRYPAFGPPPPSYGPPIQLDGFLPPPGAPLSLVTPPNSLNEDKPSPQDAPRCL
ncbi:melanoma inhibitory activity protein 2 [Thalassophryne amazonica]|uniref:melanoma inhibitory activity protein 2 n=1 Tax=Thalassophryne amazonica TaxID=390379 RepID=UPI00147233D0|nr:melanoma inhibitory activity protein 2 [Thalassophryne amazonica]